MKNMKIAGLVIAGAIAITACEPGNTTDYKSNVSGAVVEKSNHDGIYKLIIRSNRKDKLVEVSHATFFDCAMYSQYPACVKGVKTKPSKVNKAPKSTTSKKRR